MQVIDFWYYSPWDQVSTQVAHFHVGNRLLVLCRGLGQYTSGTLHVGKQTSGTMPWDQVSTQVAHFMQVIDFWYYAVDQVSTRVAHFMQVIDFWYYAVGLGQYTSGTLHVGNRLLVLHVCRGLGQYTSGTLHVGNRLLVLCRGTRVSTQVAHFMQVIDFWYYAVDQVSTRVAHFMQVHCNRLLVLCRGDQVSRYIDFCTLTYDRYSIAQTPLVLCSGFFSRLVLLE